MRSLNTELACAKSALGSLRQHFTELPSNERTNLNTESVTEEKGEGEMDQCNFGQRAGHGTTCYLVVTGFLHSVEPPLPHGYPANYINCIADPVHSANCLAVHTVCSVC